MVCPSCKTEMVVFEVPDDYREHVPDGSADAAICPECLDLAPTDASGPDPRFDRISDAFPTEPAGAVPLALALGLLDSLALNRPAVEALLADAEAAGVDALLVLDRLHAQGGVQPAFDLDRRRHQIEQLRE